MNICERVNGMKHNGMKLEWKKITTTDKELVLDLHCQTVYACDSSWAREIPYNQYREKWLSTSQPDSFFAHLLETGQDSRNLTQLLVDDTGRAVGYVWVIFIEVPDYDLLIAELMDLYVLADFRSQGIGSMIMQHVEQHAIRQGAQLLRSETGMENQASQRIHAKAGLKPYRLLYEKRL